MNNPFNFTDINNSNNTNKYEPKNEIKKAIAVDHPEYPTLMTNDQFENKLPF